MLKDYIKKFLDLSSFIPAGLRNKTNVSLMRNIFNRFLTKEETLPLYGYVGKKKHGPETTIPYIGTPNLDKKLNALIPTIYAKVGAVEHDFTFKDILNKARVLGINTDEFDVWGQAQSFNFAPPIDLDKFANFYEYYWVAQALPTLPSMPWNLNLAPEYYVIKEGISSDWSVYNYWVHKDDIDSYPGGLDKSKILRANIPIIEYDNDIELNGHYNSITGAPIDPANLSGIAYLQSKTQFNQLPLFNLYRLDGTFSGYVGPIFYYKEDLASDINQHLRRRAYRDLNSDFVFSQSLLENGSDSRMIFYKKSGLLRSIWAPGSSTPIISTPIYNSFGDGTISGLTSVDNAPSEYWTLIATSPNIFTLKGTKSGIQQNVILNAPYNNGIISFTISSGLTPFVVGDKITFRVFNREIPRYVYEDVNENIINFPGGASNDTSNVGTWLSPNQLKYNLLRENRQDVGQGDLINHFRSIIAAHPSFAGSQSSVNNYRNITHYHGLGGNIKEFNNAFNLFVSMMLQRGLSPLSILEFAESAYLQAINSIYEYFNKNILRYITENGNPTPSIIDPNDQLILNLYADYTNILKNRSDLKTTFFDSTSPIPNWPATLPQLKLTTGVVPTFEFDNELGITTIVHHDGHKSPIYLRDIEFDRLITRIPVLRSDNNEVPGVFSPTVPAFPSYKNQLWFNSITGELRSFNVKSDTPLSPTGTPLIGDFWFDNSINQLKRWNGINWIIHANIIDAWTIVDTEFILNNLLLTIETILYNAIPPQTTLSWDINNPIITTNTNFKTAQEYELAKYASKYSYDTYAPDYIYNDAFTWNYKFTVPGTISLSKSLLNLGPSIPARWYDLYKEHFSTIPGSLETSRPNLQPWKLVGEISKPTDWDSGATSIGGPGVLFKSTVPFPSLTPLTPVKLIATSNINLAGCPNILDTITLAINDRILLTNQTNQVQNGIYKVSFVGTGSNGIWTRDIDMSILSSPPIGTNVVVLDGYEWKNTVWVITTTGTVNLDPIIFGQYRTWTEAMWAWIKSQVGTYALCVNVHTDELLPPYVNPSLFGSTEALLTTIPTGVDSGYVFGDNGPIELVWRKSVEFNYGTHRSGFKVHPIKYLGDTWGNVYTKVNQFNIDRILGYKRQHTKFLYHGEEINAYNRNIIDNIIISTLPTFLTNQIISFRVENLLPVGAVFMMYKNGIRVGSNAGYVCNIDPITFIDGDVNIVNLIIKDLGIGFELGDEIVMSLSLPSSISYTFNGASTKKYLGICQYYTNLMRYNSEDLTTTYNSIFYRNWEVKLGYRMDGLIKTDNLIIKSDRITYPESSYDVVLKVDPYVSSTWLNAIRIQLVQIGTYDTEKDGTIVPRDFGSDWVFRIEHYNSKHPIIEYHSLDSSGPYQTFTALGNEHTSNEWKIYTESLGRVTQAMPFTITGIQNVLNFLYGYIKRLEEDGWVFNNLEKPEIDQVTGRTINWQLDIEVFIDLAYAGMRVGQGHILNPFMNKVWLKTPLGMVSSFKQYRYSDVLLDPLIFDVLGSVIKEDDIIVTREDDITQIESNIPIFSCHALIDEYEHIILFDKYADEVKNKGLIYDPFIGAQVSRVLLTGKKQLVRNMRPSFGGYVLNGNKLVKNIEGHIDEIGEYYDSNRVTDNEDSAKASLALLGYNKKDYFNLLDVSDKSQFNFWRGLIQAKGTNTALDAFLNTSKFDDAKIDEYWAYKLAEYGDVRDVTFPELKVQPLDTQLKHTGFQFESEDDKFNLSSELIQGFRFIKINDEDRWMSIEDLKKYQYFLAEQKGQYTTSDEILDGTLIQLPFLSEMQLEVPHIDYTGTGNGILTIEPPQITNNNFALDIPEIWTLTAITPTTFSVTVNNPSGTFVLPIANIDEVYSAVGYERMIFKISSGTTPFTLADEFTFTLRCNKVFNSVIKVHYKPVAEPITIIGMRPSNPKFNPIKLIDYQEKDVISDISLWHPLLDIHERTALEAVNIKGPVDPAYYNYATQTVNNTNYRPLKAWGNNEIGKIWWDTSKVSYLPYNEFSNVDEKLARWGSLADYASIDVYEWIESDIPPTEYDAQSKVEDGNAEIDKNIRASGQAAGKEYYSRDRIWYARPIAWSYSQIPVPFPTLLTSYFSNIIFLSTTTPGNSTIILGSGRFEDYGIINGMKVSGWDITNQIPIGEMTIDGDIDYALGSETDPAIPFIIQDPNFTSITLIKSASNITDTSLGEIKLSNEIDGGIYYIRATVTASGLTQRIEITTITDPIGTEINYDFDLLGITIIATTATTPINDNIISQIIGNIDHNIFIRQTITGTITLEMPDNEFSNDPFDSLQYGWAAWSDPTQDQLSIDLLEPNNSWKPIYGDYVRVPTITQEFIETVKSFNNLILLNGTIINKYKFEWTNWVKMQNIIMNILSDGSPPTLTFDNNIDPNRFSLYVNGVLQPQSYYTIVNNIVTMTLSPGEGHSIIGINRHYTPAESELSFNPDISDNESIQTQYKADYQYVTVPTRDSIGNIIGNKYYYWVTNKTTVAKGKKLSIQQITNLLKFGPSLFVTFEKLLPSKYLSQTDKILYPRYNAISVSNLGRYITKENSFKLRFTKDFALRDDPNDLDLKNKHIEWTLIRPGQKYRIPKQLWTKIVDAAAGQDQSGNSLPSAVRSEYDVRHGTRTRYGFGLDQIFADSTLVISSLIYTILNTKLIKNNGSGIYVPNTLETVIDFNNSKNWFSDSSNTRITMEKIWQEGRPEQINELFFAVLEDALANNYEFTDIFKTSRLSAYSLRVIPQILQSEYDEY